MSHVVGFVASVLLSIALALLVALVLRRPLGDLLVELCGNERRARFWAAFTSVSLVLGSMLGALYAIPPETEQGWESALGLRMLLVGLRWSTSFLLTVIAIMGFVMLVGISRASVDREEPAARPSLR